jgi:hypothetical protein
MRGWHRKGVLRLGNRDRLAAVILPGQGALFTIGPSPPHHRLGGSRLSGVLAAHDPTWYVVFQGLLGVIQFAIGLVMVASYRRAGVWGAF